MRAPLRQFSRRAWVFGLTGAGVCAGPQTDSGKPAAKNSMDEGFRRFSRREQVTIQADPRAITAASSPATPRRDNVPGEQAILGRYVNDRLNSRAPAPLGAARTLKRVWGLDLRMKVAPIAIAQSGDRALVFSLSDWVLCDLAGKQIARGLLQHGEARLDPGRQLFYAPNFAGLIVAYRLSDGGVEFNAFFRSTKRYFRSFITRFERRMILLSTELHLDMGKPEPENTILEVSDLGDPANQKSFGQKGEPRVVAELVRATRSAFVALHREAVVYATADRIYGLDLNLTVRRILTGSFQPVAISLDDSGHVYLLAEEGNRTVLSYLTMAGERRFAYSLPEGVHPSYAPIIGYDHTVYLLTSGMIYAVGVDGKERWARPAGAAGGAMVGSDDALVVSEGPAIAAYSGSLGRRELIRHEAPFVTAPTLFAPGRILAATESTLYLFEAAG
jgi:hypothetical protein